jgi:hypothetical protein
MRLVHVIFENTMSNFIRRAAGWAVEGLEFEFQRGQQIFPFSTAAILTLRLSSVLTNGYWAISLRGEVKLQDCQTGHSLSL